MACYTSVSQSQQFTGVYYLVSWFSPKKKPQTRYLMVLSFFWQTESTLRKLLLLLFSPSTFPWLHMWWLDLKSFILSHQECKRWNKNTASSLPKRVSCHRYSFWPSAKEVPPWLPSLGLTCQCSVTKRETFRRQRKGCRERHTIRWEKIVTLWSKAALQDA